MARITRIGTLCLVMLAWGMCDRAAAQVDDGGFWMALFTQGEFNDDCDCDCQRPLKWWFDGHARFNDDGANLVQGIARPGIGVPLTERATIWAGYAWIRTLPLTAGAFNENRIWQQITWSKKQHALTFAARSRLEQRFVETGDDMGWRFRQLLRVQHNLPCQPRLTLVAWDEMFFHLNDTDFGAQTGFDQNRVFLGVGYKRCPESRWRVETGYLNQYIDNTGGGADISNHLLSVNFYRSP